MAAPRSINDVAEASEAEFPRLSESPSWWTAERRVLNASAFAFHNNLRVVADRQDKYHQMAVQRYLRYQTTSRSGRRGDETTPGAPTIGTAASAETASARATVDETMEKIVEENWPNLKSLLAAFEQNGNTIYMRRSKKSTSAARAFLTFLRSRMADDADPLQALLGKLDDDEAKQQAFFVDLGARFKKGSATSTVNKSRGQKRRRVIEDEDEENDEHVEDENPDAAEDDAEEGAE